MFHILRRDDAGHSLLGFRDRKLGSVKSGVFLGYLIQIDLKTLGQLADGYGDSAGAKVIALADQLRDLRSSEHALQLSLCRRISLLNFGTAHLDGGCRVRLGGTGCSSDPVASGPSAQQYDHIAGPGSLADHIFSGSSRHDSADLHALGNVCRMVDLFHIAGRKTDLIPVGAVAVSRLADQLLLRKLTLERIGHGSPGIRRSGHAHRLVDVGAA